MSKARILVVDDEPFNLDIVAEYLEIQSALTASVIGEFAKLTNDDQFTAADCAVHNVSP